MAEWLSEEGKQECLDTSMWQARPVLYEHLSKGYSHRTKFLAALPEMAEVLYAKLKAWNIYGGLLLI